jgi:hypothetical protein
MRTANGHGGYAARVTALQAPMRIAWDVTSRRGVEQREFLIIPSAGPTTLVQRLTLQPRNVLLWRLRDRWRKGRMSLEHRAELARIKAVVEGSFGAKA